MVAATVFELHPPTGGRPGWRISSRPGPAATRPHSPVVGRTVPETAV